MKATARADRDLSAAADEAPQALVGFRTNEEWQALVAEVSAAIGAIDEIDDADLRGQVLSMLQGIDAIHREALQRLVRLFKEGVLEQVVTDPAIRTLMGMYDLLPPEEPGCAKVWDFLEPQHPRGQEGSSGPVAASAPGMLPHWSPASLSHSLTEGEAVVCEFEEALILLARVRGETFAVEAECPHHRAPLSGGRLAGYSWVCPHGQGCLYDLRNGARLGGGAGLICRPVREDAGERLMIGFGIPFEPSLPAF